MDLPPFALERYFAAREFAVSYVLCASDPEPWRLAAPLELADTQCHRFGRLDCSQALDALRRFSAARLRAAR